MSEEKRFKDRVSEFPNRRRLKILSQTVDELIVNVEREEGNVSEQGTPINAQVFNDWEKSVSEAKSDAVDAKTKANQNTELINELMEDTDRIEAEVEGLGKRVEEGMGTVVKVNNQYVPIIEFEAPLEALLDSKLDRRELLDLIYPVGSIYMTVEETFNPNNVFGGTWSVWGSGRVPVGISGESEFNEMEKTGGSKSYQKHNHCLTIDETTGLNGTLAFKTYSSATAGDGAIFLETWSDSGVTPSGTSKDKNVKVAIDVNHKHTGSIDEHGAGTSGNLPPYIVCKMWKREEDNI